MSALRKWRVAILAVLLLIGALPFRGTQAVDVDIAKPKVSVIVPVYNVEPYLRECLDSVKNQTLREIEIICVDDGSPDNCGEILDEYAKKDERFIIIHQENKGLPMARQAGMDIARGEYMKHVDSDDYLDLDALEICYNEAKKDDVDILVHGAYAFNQDKQRIARQFPYRLITDQQFGKFGGAMWNKLYKSEFIRKNNFNYYGVCNMGEDEFFNMVCIPAAKRLKTIPKILYHYREYPQSLMATVKGEKNAKERLNNILKAYKYWRKNGYFSNATACLKFLRWELSSLQGDEPQIYKMFHDTLSELEPNLLTDKKLVAQLTKRERNKLNKILASVPRQAVNKTL